MNKIGHASHAKMNDSRTHHRIINQNCVLKSDRELYKIFLSFNIFGMKLFVFIWFKD